jgi:hypothetical protein
MAPAVLNISSTLSLKLHPKRLAKYYFLSLSSQQLRVAVMLDYPPFAWWPVNKPGLANDIIPGHHPAVMRIIAVVAIITEDEVFVLRNYCGRHRVVWRRHDIWLIQSSAVDKNFAVFNLHGIAGQANNAFDERVGGLLIWRGRVKDYYISALWARGMVTHLVNYNAFTLLEIGLHTGHYHSIALYSEMKESKNGYGDKNGYDDFAKNFH